jgi:hypothetical protein
MHERIPDLIMDILPRPIQCFMASIVDGTKRSRYLSGGQYGLSSWIVDQKTFECACNHTMKKIV